MGVTISSHLTRSTGGAWSKMIRLASPACRRRQEWRPSENNVVEAAFWIDIVATPNIVQLLLGQSKLKSTVPRVSNRSFNRAYFAYFQYSCFSPGAGMEIGIP
jgi:hypothetical protein